MPKITARTQNVVAIMNTIGFPSKEPERFVRRMTTMYIFVRAATVSANTLSISVGFSMNNDLI